LKGRGFSRAERALGWSSASALHQSAKLGVNKLQKKLII
jgi:hypothetical protein